ncbi:hypothetical protein [Flammeovirga pacifica]|uniref:Uncharacterized protein n=1 Tax=Flammeovirga pacifica TaxID=915059 RepID=A0A1S1Z1B3_FLAPC|nr:hypothetical protein [Flammeovirga pacifica]OHX67059.1 hypothetical protein NH26_12235 [Flammeovirga pacifica]
MKNKHISFSIITILFLMLFTTPYNGCVLGNNEEDDKVTNSEEEPSEKFNYTNRKSISFPDSISDAVIHYGNQMVSFNFNKTYFIPGAGFCKSDYKNTETFNYELMSSLKELLREDFVTVESSKKNIPLLPLRTGLSGRWAILNGYEPVDYQKHGNIKRTIEDIEGDLGTSSTEKINVIGSSYGSVVAANTVISLIERENNIDEIGVLVLSASMIDPSSKLGLKLSELHQSGKIETLYYHSTPKDNITACSGTSKKEARMGFKKVVFKTSPSIMNLKKHAHNIASRTPQRAHDLLDVIIQNSEVLWVKSFKKGN